MQLNKWLQNIIFAHFTILHDLILCMCICVHAPCMYEHISFVYKYIIICKIFQKEKENLLQHTQYIYKLLKYC